MGPTGWPLGPGEWWACEHPERPPDPPFSRLHVPGTCRPCVIAVDARLRRDPDAADTLSQPATGSTMADYLRLATEALEADR